MTEIMIISIDREKMRVKGVYEPLRDEIKFKAVWGNHEFTDDECEKLLNGETITFLAKSSSGMNYIAKGKLEYQEYNNVQFWGFKRNKETAYSDKKKDIEVSQNTKLFIENEKIKGVYAPTNEFVQFNRKWSGHLFNDDECKQLLSGLPITFTAISSKGEYTVTGSLQQQSFNGKNYWGFAKDNDAIPKEWQGHVFTHEEINDLRNGDIIYIPDAISKNTNRKFRCTLCYTEVNGRKKLVPVRV